jgi:hypothetical protein
MLNEALSSDHDINKSIVHFDSGINIILTTMQFVMSKHPHAYWLYPRDIPVHKLRIKDTRIIWKASTKTIQFPKKYWENWETVMNDPSIRFIVIAVRLISEEDGRHANVLIYDKNTKELERFDGLGKDIAETYHIDDFDNQIEKKFVETDRSIKYFRPVDYCPAKIPVFQSKELDEIPGVDLRGNCAVWRLWYIDVRLSNPHLSRKQLVDLASRKLREDAGSLHKFIKMYQKYIFDHVKMDYEHLQKQNQQKK